MRVRGQVLVAGRATGSAVTLDHPLSFWGGFDPVLGTVIDHHHPQVGTCLSGAIVVMPAGRGSSSASSVIAEAARRATAPAGFVLVEPDDIIVTGSVVADELYGVAVPVVVLDTADHQLASGAASIAIGANGEVDLS